MCRHRADIHNDDAAKEHSPGKAGLVSAKHGARSSRSLGQTAVHRGPGDKLKGISYHTLGSLHLYETAALLHEQI